MHRYIDLQDDRQRNAQVALWSPEKNPDVEWLGPHGQPVESVRIVKATEGFTPQDLLKEYGSPEALGAALIDADPEINREVVGRRAGSVERVWIDPDGHLLYSARLLQTIKDPQGNEIERRDFVDVDANIGDGQILPWTGRMLPTEDVIQRYALVRKLQVRHTNRLTFDFLFDLAVTLQREQKMLHLGAGPQGRSPLIMQRNGSPYQGFLEGRVEGRAYLLILHLSNLELKSAPKPDAS